MPALLSTTQLSVRLFPVYNEEQGLQVLFDLLYPHWTSSESATKSCLYNDGSRDRFSAAYLAANNFKSAQM